MKYAFSALFALFPATAFAHSGHVEKVAGHTHTLVDLMLLGAIPALILVAAAALYWLVARRNG